MDRLTNWHKGAWWLAALVLTGPLLAAPEAPKEALVTGVTAQTLSAAGDLRLTFTLTAARDDFRADYTGQGTFWVELPATALARAVAGKHTVALGAVSDVVCESLGKGAGVRLSIHLNSPVACKPQAATKGKASRIIVDVAAPPAKPVKLDPNPLVSVEFVETDLRVVLSALVAQSGANLLVKPSVTATNVSIKLTKVSLTDALEALCATYGLLWTRGAGGIITIGTDTDLGSQPTSDRLVVPAAVKPEEFATAVREQFAGLTVSVEPAKDGKPAGVLLRGPLKLVTDVRRQASTIDLGAAAQSKAVTIPYYPRFLAPADAEKDVLAHCTGISAKHDEYSVSLTGGKEEVDKAWAYLRGLDDDPVVKETLWMPGQNKEVIASLAKLLQGDGVELTAIGEGDSMLVVASGKKSKLEPLRKLSTTLVDAKKAAATARSGGGRSFGGVGGFPPADTGTGN